MFKHSYSAMAVATAAAMLISLAEPMRTGKGDEQTNVQMNVARVFPERENMPAGHVAHYHVPMHAWPVQHFQNYGHWYPNGGSNRYPYAPPRRAYPYPFYYNGPG